MADRKFKDVIIDIYRVGPPSRTVISWEWEESVIPLSRYKIDIYRGESPEEMERIAKDIPADMYSEWEDNTARLISKNRTYYYQVVAKNCGTGDKVKSKKLTKEGDLDLVGIYIVEEHDFFFRHIAGTPVYIYKKQTDSKTRCGDCWDPILKRVTKSSCKSCNGTGMIGKGVGGYYNPTYTWVDFQPDPEIVQTAQWGKTEPTQTDIFMSNYPRMSVGDIIIELTTDRRWKVTNVRDSEKRRTKMLQIVRLDLINKDQVEYTIKVPEEIIDKASKELNESKREKEF